MKILQGVSASPGIAIGPLYIYQPEQVSYRRYTPADPSIEWQRLQDALLVADLQIRSVYEKAMTEAGSQQAAIFETQADMLHDPGLLGKTRQNIQEQNINVEAALMDAAEFYARTFENVENEYMQVRAADVRDVAFRLLCILTGAAQPSADIAEPSILVSRDLTPSDTVRLDKKLVIGFCTAEGGATSHTSILAKAMGIPAVVGAGKEILALPNGTLLAVDGERGEVIIEPDEETIRAIGERRKKADALYAAERRLAHEPAVTMDGVNTRMLANIGSVSEAETALELGAEGVGLLRTEFLFLDRSDPPSEEEQYLAYKSILDMLGDLPMTVRTLDIGGDKPPPYLNLTREDNPFLGNRAIRMCLEKPSFFKVQLRALLRASHGRNLRIMFPMIAQLMEFRKAKTLLEEARAEVIAAGHVVADKVEVGVMVEIPAVVMMADQFAREADFFSIGTNDLTQYTMAAERTNDKLSYLADACHPAILRQVQRVIDSAHSCGIWVGLCGELAGDSDAIPILLGMGLDEFSMAPTMIPHAKAIIRRWTMTLGQKCVRDVLEHSSAGSVRQHMRRLRAG